jgi:biopolymer transport protein ExbD
LNPSYSHVAALAIVENAHGRHRLSAASASASSKAEINVVPYIDVMLVLLIIFMVTAPLLNLGVDIDLPQANAKPLDTPEDPVVVSVRCRPPVPRAWG